MGFGLYFRQLGIDRFTIEWSTEESIEPYELIEVLLDFSYQGTPAKTIPFKITNSYFEPTTIAIVQ